MAACFTLYLQGIYIVSLTYYSNAREPGKSAGCKAWQGLAKLVCFLLCYMMQGEQNGKRASRASSKASHSQATLPLALGSILALQYFRRAKKVGKENAMVDLLFEFWLVSLLAQYQFAP
jgi:hypothetical protein